MLDEPQQALVQKTVLTLQAVIFAVAGGAIVAFLALLMLVPAPPAEAPVEGESESTPWLSIVACCVAVSTAVIAPVLRQAMQRTQRMALASSTPTDDAGLASTLLAALTTRYVVSAALFEGAMLLGAVAYFMERRTWVLWPAAAMLALLLRLVPRRAAVEQTLEGDLAELRHAN